MNGGTITRQAQRLTYARLASALHQLVTATLSSAPTTLDCSDLQRPISPAILVKDPVVGRAPPQGSLSLRQCFDRHRKAVVEMILIVDLPFCAIGSNGG